ncbi:hypothetical protein B0H19DRAFT_1276408 [Mycena capillaripes]|nr:hypothetical protein B0H19DRAFT_1276408 [Mycena capillaripes]
MFRWMTGHRKMSRSLAPHNPVDLCFFPHSSPQSHWPLRDYLSVTIEVPLVSKPTLRTHPPTGHSLTLNKTVDIFTLPAQPSLHRPHSTSDVLQACRKSHCSVIVHSDLSFSQCSSIRWISMTFGVIDDPIAAADLKCPSQPPNLRWSTHRLCSVGIFRPRLCDVDSACTRADFALVTDTQLSELNCVLRLAHESRWLFADITNPTGMNAQALLARGPSTWI